MQPTTTNQSSNPIHAANPNANPANKSSATQNIKKLWDNCTFENLRNSYSFVTNLTTIGSVSAALLPNPIKQVIPPVLGSISYSTLQAVYRADNDQLRKKIDKHKKQYDILRGFLPVGEQNNGLYKVADKDVALTQYGVDPYAKGTALASWTNIILALAAGGLVGYMSHAGLDNWDTDSAKGLGALALILWLIPSIASVIEEHQKRDNLGSIDKAYKSKISVMKTYFFAQNDINTLQAYHEQSKNIQPTPALT